ncbi:MAG: hypothetical protein HRT58_19220 [Crocinitomicaceae bacterium]|nr:hypothetical protein [Flavobacteriales bacterium]NQZ37802.1 hypothetical protein [Crocinitomicaceae bacterium]
MKHILSLVILTGILAACSADPTANGVDPIVDEVIVSTITDFSETEFKNPVHIDLLRELEICEFKSVDSTYFATCSPDNFKIIEYKDDVSVKDAFILEMRAGIFPKGQKVPLPPVRHIIVFEREGSELVRVGGFRGDLIEMRKNKSGVNDLLIGLFDKDDGGVLFYCWFDWNGRKYEFKEIEGLDFGEGPKPLKEEMRESMTQEIYQKLMEKSLIF